MRTETERATFGRALRVRKRREYLEIQSTGAKRHVAHFLVVTKPPPAEAAARLGVTVSKRVGGSVERNRVKRRVREFFRRNRGRLVRPIVLVVVAKAGAAELDQRAVDRELEAALGL